MIKNTKIPIRTCIGCQNKKPKKEMVRLIRTPEGNYEIDTTGKKSGRGAYLCYNIECLDIALREKRLNRSFKKDIPAQIINELRRFLEEHILKSSGR
ncbi:MAG: YlxR family protein [Candidatus Atribacteria bacterium]